MKLILSRIRNTKGQASAIMNLMLGIMVVAVIGLFSFELSRYFLARDQLKTITEAAALCCETALVSSSDPLNTTYQSNAVNSAVALFQQNTILGQSMANATSQPNVADLAPGPGQAQICFQFLNPVNHQPIVNQPGNPNPPSGALIQATGAYCYTPAFGQFIGLGQAQFTFQVSAFSGVPRIDVVLAFDISGPMDDQTPTSFVQRTSNPVTGGGGGAPGGGGGGPGGNGGAGGNCVEPIGSNYMFTTINGTANTGSTIADSLHNPGGSVPSVVDVNAMPPQNLNNPNGVSGIANAPVYSETQAATKFLAGFNGNTNTAGFTGFSAGDTCFCNGNNNGGKGGPVSYLDDIAITPRTAAHKSAHARKAKLIASARSDSKEDLRHLCAQLNSVSGHKKITKDFDFTKLDGQLNKISFMPLFAAYPGGPSSFTAGSVAAVAAMAAANAAASGTAGPSGPVGPVGPASPPYIDPINNMTYDATSHTGPGSGGGLPNYNSNSPPTIPGLCTGPNSPNGPSPILSGAAAPNVYTDLVVNLDGNPVFTGYTSPNNFNYLSGAGNLVEAARGNLDNAATAIGAFVDFNGMGVIPIPGYASDYNTNAQLMLQPFNDLLYAAVCLVYEMSNVADAHFSFIAFNDTAGNANTGVTPSQYSANVEPGYLPMISSFFPYAAPAPTAAGSAIYILPPLPFVALDPNNTNNDLMTQLPTDIRPNGNRNVAAVLQAAISQLTTNGRPGANKVIVVFCDGVPTEANKSNAAALQDALAQAQTAAANGITIYCVAVADPKSNAPPDDTSEDAAYSDNNGGICAQAAPGPNTAPRWYRVDWGGAGPTLSNLSSVVDNIVRQMVNMIH